MLIKQCNRNLNRNINLLLLPLLVQDISVIVKYHFIHKLSLTSRNCFHFRIFFNESEIFCWCLFVCVSHPHIIALKSMSSLFAMTCTCRAVMIIIIIINASFPTFHPVSHIHWTCTILYCFVFSNSNQYYILLLINMFASLVRSNQDSNIVVRSDNICCSACACYSR